jgi:hypothetical protein
MSLFAILHLWPVELAGTQDLVFYAPNVSACVLSIFVFHSLTSITLAKMVLTLNQRYLRFSCAIFSLREVLICTNLTLESMCFLQNWWDTTATCVVFVRCGLAILPQRAGTTRCEYGEETHRKVCGRLQFRRLSFFVFLRVFFFFLFFCEKTSYCSQKLSCAGCLVSVNGLICFWWLSSGLVVCIFPSTKWFC